MIRQNENFALSMDPEGERSAAQLSKWTQLPTFCCGNFWLTDLDGYIAVLERLSDEAKLRLGLKTWFGYGHGVHFPPISSLTFGAHFDPERSTLLWNRVFFSNFTLVAGRMWTTVGGLKGMGGKHTTHDGDHRKRLCV